MTKYKAIQLLQKQIEIIESLRELSEYTNAPEFKKWARNTQVAIENIFNDIDKTKELIRIPFRPAHNTPVPINRKDIFNRYPTHRESYSDRFKNQYINGLNESKAKLESMCDEIQEYWPDDSDKNYKPKESKKTQNNSTSEIIEREERQLTISEKNAVAILQEKRDILESFLSQEKSVESIEFIKWKRNTQSAIKNIFGNKSDNINEFNEIGFLSYVNYSNGGKVCYIERNKALALLDSFIDDIKLYGLKNQHSLKTNNNEMPETSTPRNNKIFIIHGHDHGTKDTIARFLEKHKLVPVILQDLPNQGQTIIEKFEAHADVSYAIALFTPDDEGCAVGEKEKNKPRARQNVIFELGFFIAKLGRKHTVVLHKGEVEIPSDYSGVIYISLDKHDGWKLKLVKELKAAGFEIDANKML
jgi:predicted nucleotide-binding protein